MSEAAPNTAAPNTAAPNTAAPNAAAPNAAAPNAVAPNAAAPNAAVLNAAARAAIDAGRVAHLTTLNPDGSPQTTVIWVGLDGDRLAIASMDPRQKVRNAQRDPRVSLSMEADGKTHGLNNYLVVEGHAEVVEGGAAALLQTLAHHYMGPDVVFPPGENLPPGYRILITPKKVRGNGPWND